MIEAIIIIIACLLLSAVLLPFLRIKIIISYKKRFAVYVGALFFRIRLFPFPKFKKNKPKGPHSMSAKKAAKIRERVRLREEQKRLRRIQKEQERQKKKQEQTTGEKNNKKLDVSTVIDIVDAARSITSEVLGVSLSHLRLDLARLHVTVATDDAATTALAYGAVCASLDTLLSILQPLKGFHAPKTKQISVNYDFLSEQPKLDLKLCFSMRIWHGMHIVLAALKQTGGQLFSKGIVPKFSQAPNAKQ